MSYCLTERGVDHLVLDRNRPGYDWRERRWDSFCLVTPNWQCQLPGYPYDGPDPDGFMVRDQIADYLEGYAASFGPPLALGTEVTRLRRRRDGVFELTSPAGDLTADQVVVATGPHQLPAIPPAAQRLPDGITQLHSSQYRRPWQLPPGAVLVVGSGQSGAQIAEDLHLVGRQVHLAVGSAPRVARRYRGRDVVAWLHDMGYYDKGIGEFPDAEGVRLRANHYLRHPGPDVSDPDAPDPRAPDPRTLPPALKPDDPVLAQVAALAGDMVVCVGYCEADGDDRYNSAACVTGDGVLGRHRKVHLPAGEVAAYRPGDRFAAFDTPVGRLGLLIDYDKTFPEAARTLAVDGAEILAWLFDLYDCARAAENQVVMVSANQTGTMGGLRFLGQSKVVGPAPGCCARSRPCGRVPGAGGGRYPLTGKPRNPGPPAG